MCVVTGFFIAHADPPCGETDGPLGALFLARALTPLGIRVALITDAFCKNALQVGLETSGLRDASLLGVLPPATQPWDVFLNLSWEHFRTRHRLSHLIALERVGPSHTSGNSDSFYSMRGLDVSSHTCPAHRIFEQVKKTSGMRTIGIGDGGNEIGMGKIPHDVIARNVPNGGLIACRVPTDHLIVCGVSNWGAYALAAGVALLRGAKLDPDLFDVERERELLRIMVEKGPLVDGVTGKPTVSVDGLPFDEYVRPLRRIKELLGY